MMKLWPYGAIQHIHTHTFNGPFSGTTRVSWYQKGEINLDFTEARDSEWQWYQLGHMQVCTSLQTAPHHSVFYRPDAVPAAQPTAWRHWKHYTNMMMMMIIIIITAARPVVSSSRATQQQMRAVPRCQWGQAALSADVPDQRTCDRAILVTSL